MSKRAIREKAGNTYAPRWEGSQLCTAFHSGYPGVVDLADRLDALHLSESSPRKKLRDALELFDDGVEMQRLVLKRRHPELSEPELEAKLLAWLARQDEFEAS